MSRFQKLSHVVWHCQYHIVWVPKFRYRVLRGPVAEEVFNCIHVFAGRLGCEIIELNVQPATKKLLQSTSATKDVKKNKKHPEDKGA